MLVPALVSIIIVLGAIVFHLYFLAPKMNPKNKAEILLRENRVAEAIVEFNKVLEYRPYDILTHYKLADLYFQQGKKDLGAGHLEKIVNINRFTDEVDKTVVYKMLADYYLKKGDQLKAFERFFEILKDDSNDPDALYHVGFLCLGQEIFDAAFRYLYQLARVKKKSFDVLFGAGIAGYQTQRISEAISYFREALNIMPNSDITNIALAFSYFRKKEYKSPMSLLQGIIDNSLDDNARFIAKRLLAFAYIEIQRIENAIHLFEELLEYCSDNQMEDEIKVTLYDIGFACFIGTRKEEAYNYWNQLYQRDRNFRNILDLVTRLRKEMDVKPGSKFDESRPLQDEVDGWKDEAFPEGYVWNICGLRSDTVLDLGYILSQNKTQTGRDRKNTDDVDVAGGSFDLNDIYSLDTETFRSVAYRMCEKLGLVIDEILNTYRESDGVDFMAHQKDSRDKVLVWVRRWKGSNIGEIPLRNFAQAINDTKVKQGYFVTSSSLSTSGENALGNLDKVVVIYPHEFAKLIKGLV